MSDERIPKRLLYGQLLNAKRHPGGQRKWYKDQLRVNLKPAILTIQNWNLWQRIGPSGGDYATAQ